MSEGTSEKGRARRRVRWGAIRPNLRYQRRRLAAGVRNRWRRWRKRRYDYIVFPVGGPLPERSAPPRRFYERYLPLPPRPLSLQTLIHNFELVADADNVHGVLIVLRRLTGGPATLQSLRAAIRRLRAAGKEVVVYTPYLDFTHFYVACAADRIVAPPPVEFSVVGFQVTLTYFKDALDRVGVQADVVQTSPFKAAASALTETDPTPEEEAQRTWLLDDLVTRFSAEIAADRGLSPDDVRALIDQAPFAAATAREHGLIDDVAYDDELARLLARPATPTQRAADDAAGDAAGDAADPPATRPARLVRIGDVRHRLLEKVRRESDRYIGVLSVQGTIMMTDVDSLLPVGGSVTASEATLTRLLRRAAADHDMAALVLYVDSPGGDALASDLIGRSVAALARRKPVVVYMGDVAASGGYYVSAPAAHIVAQPATVTGSIGVIATRISTQRLRQSAGVNEFTIRRGAHAGLYRDLNPLTDEERTVLEERIGSTYNQFKQVVAAGRELPFDELDAICEGRVWTGHQALGHGLVDALGDLHAAVAEARRLAGLPEDDGIEVPVVNMYGQGDGYVVPPLGDSAESVTYLARAARQLLDGQLARTVNDRTWLLMPFSLRFW